MNHQPPNWDAKYGHSEILDGILFLSDEDDFDE